MKDTDFPRVVKKGVLKGQTFATNADYQQALKRYKAERGIRTTRKSPTPKPRSEGDRFRLEVHRGGIHIVVEGPITGDVTDTLLTAVARATGQ